MLTFRSIFSIVFILLLQIFPYTGWAENHKSVSRTVLALYDGNVHSEARDTRIHQLAEMPLTHLGLELEYHDIREPLPPVSTMGNFRGVITWFDSQKMPKPVEFIRWAEQVLDSGIRFVILGSIGVSEDLNHKKTPLKKINSFLGRLGLKAKDHWKTATEDVRLIHKDPTMTEFERPYKEIPPPFLQIWNVDEKSITYLLASWGKGRKHESDLVVVSPLGGYAASGYTHLDVGGLLEWYLNPFEFFRQALATDEVPEADSTTLSDRRNYVGSLDEDS